MISKSLIVGVGLAGASLGLAGGFVGQAQAAPYSCSASTTIGSCTASTSINLTKTEWVNTSQIFAVSLFNTSVYAPMTSMSLVISGTINFGPNSTLTNTSATSQTFVFSESTSFSFSSANALLASALNSLSSIAVDAPAISALGPNQTAVLPTAPGAAFNTNITGPFVDFEKAGGGVSVVGVSTLTGQTLSGGGGNVNSSITTSATITVSYVYNYGTTVPEPLSAAVLGSGLLGLGMLRRRKRA